MSVSVEGFVRYDDDVISLLSDVMVCLINHNMSIRSSDGSFDIMTWMNCIPMEPCSYSKLYYSVSVNFVWCYSGLHNSAHYLFLFSFGLLFTFWLVWKYMKRLNKTVSPIFLPWCVFWFQKQPFKFLLLQVPYSSKTDIFIQKSLNELIYI